MWYLLLSIMFSVLLLVNFRLFPKYNIDTFQAIVFNYPVCFITGYLLMDKGDSFQMDLSQSWVWYCLLLGLAFIVTFILSGAATQRIGMTVTSMANNISLVIPVLFSLLVFKSAIDFTAINYLGLVLGLVAVGIAGYKTDNIKHQAGFMESGGLALAVFLMYGITNTAINYIQMNIIKDKAGVIPVMLVMIVGSVITGLLILAYQFIRGKERFSSINLIAAVTLGVPNFLSFYYLIQTLNHFGSSGAFVYPLYNMGVIFLSAIVGILWFKEKISKLNQIGLLLALVSILFISWNALFIN